MHCKVFLTKSVRGFYLKSASIKSIISIRKVASIEFPSIYQLFSFQHPSYLTDPYTNIFKRVFFPDCKTHLCFMPYIYMWCVSFAYQIADIWNRAKKENPYVKRIYGGNMGDIC